MGALEHEGCGGVWQPCPGWVARYQCDKCKTLGLRERQATAERDVLGNGSAFGKQEIRPYLCAARVRTPEDPERRNRPCGKFASARMLNGSKRYVCWEHHHEQQAKANRR